MGENEKENQTPEWFEERDLFGQIKSKLKTPELLEDINKSENKPNLNVEYAGLGSRLIAYFLDVIIMLIPLVFLDEVVFGVSWTSTENSLQRNLFGLVVWTLYYAATESSDSQATFGKRICGIKVIDDYGNKLTFKKAAFRYLAQIISIIPLGFGIWAIAKDEKKQAWHDMILGCYVIVNKSKPLQTLDEAVS